MYATCFYVSYSFLCISLISRYLTHFSISVYHIIVSYTTLTQDLTPDLAQDLTQDLTPDLTQDLTGNLIPDLTPDLTWNLTQDLTWNLT